MKKLVIFAVIGLFSATVYAFNPTLKNEDSQSYKYQVKCGGSTTHSSIGSHTSMTLSGKNGCTLIIEGAGSAKLAEDMKCKIVKSTLYCE